MNLRRDMLVAFAYALLSWLLLGHVSNLTQRLLGYGQDPGAIIWFLAWWPWAAAHHALAAHTYLVWQPRGLNLAWTTSVPLLALIAAPVTLTAGPLLAYNLLLLAAPALAALAAYALGRSIAAPRPAAFLGGLIFAFSSFTAAQSFDHLNLVFTALVPLTLLVALRRLQGKTGRLGTMLGLGLLLGADFLISDERVAMSCLFGALAWLLAYGELPVWRPALRRLAVDIACAAPLAMLVAAPVLAGMLTSPADVRHPPGWPGIFSADALNLIIPTQATWLGGQVFLPLSRHFSGGLDEEAAYLGLPFLLLLPLMRRQLAGLPGLRTLLLSLLAVVLLSLGPRLHVGGADTGIILPWDGLAYLPVLGQALPARCMLFAALAAALLAMLWLAQAPTPRRYAAMALICLTVLPAPHGGQPAPDSAFFRPGRVQQMLGPNPTLLILPFGINGPSAYWQAQNQFGFTQAGGYLGYPPAWAQADKAVNDLFFQFYGPALPAELAAFCRHTGTRYVVLAPGAFPAERAALAALDWPGKKIDDVTIFTVKPGP